VSSPVSVAPLDDPAYVPAHPPVGGLVPDVVVKWGAASQLRWFHRFGAALEPQPQAVWDRYYLATTAHRGKHCDCVDVPGWGCCYCESWAE
jgi:hypothetical protein